MPNQAENKSVVGLKDLHVALVTQDDASAYAAETPEYFAPAINVSQSPATNSKTQYADDGPFDSMVSEGETKLEVDTTAIPLSMQAKVLGKGFDAGTGRMFDNGGTPPEVALSFRSEKSTGNYKYFQYLKGRFAAPNEEQNTKTDSPDPKSTKVTFTAIKTVHQFDLGGGLMDGVKRVVGDEDADNFNGATWFDTVQVPVVGAPAAFTCTPSPADGASGQATGVAIALTFSNALKGNAELGVTLTRVDTGAVIAVTRSLSANRKVLTLGHAALVATKQYFITLSGVKDVYGQTLADTVYDFTIA